MSVGSWEPEPRHKPSGPLDLEFLKRCASNIGEQESVVDLVNAEERETQRGLMTLPATDWEAVCLHWDSDSLRALVRFLTLAEEQLPGWEAGAKSPVIHLVKALRGRGEAPDKALLMWIRAHSSNRYLPNGPLL